MNTLQAEQELLLPTPHPSPFCKFTSAGRSSLPVGLLSLLVSCFRGGGGYFKQINIQTAPRGKKSQSFETR